MKRTNIFAGLCAGLLGVASLLAAPAALAAGGGAGLLEFRVDTGNMPSLQRGAAAFKGYCSGCHSLKYLRYNRMGKDLGLTEDMVKANFMTDGEKVGDPMFVSMPKESADWFGAAPPDLTLTARSRGPAWVYTYLNSFYLDPTRPLGVNNTVLPGASMPHVLWELQGWQKKAEHHEAAAGEGHEAKPAAEQGGGHHAAKPFELAQPGSLNEEQYKKFTADLTNFLVYAAEPARNQRIAKGWSVLAFLLVFFVLAWLLNKEYWKDVH